MAILAKSCFSYFEDLLELRSLLKDKYKLLSLPFSFRFCLHKYHPSCPTTRTWLPPEISTNHCRTQNRPSSPLEDYCFSTLLTLQWKVIARIQPGKNRSVWTCLIDMFLFKTFFMYDQYLRARRRLSDKIFFSRRILQFTCKICLFHKKDYYKNWRARKSLQNDICITYFFLILS